MTFIRLYAPVHNSSLTAGWRLSSRPSHVYRTILKTQLSHYERMCRNGKNRVPHSCCGQKMDFCHGIPRPPSFWKRNLIPQTLSFLKNLLRFSSTTIILPNQSGERSQSDERQRRIIVTDTQIPTINPI